MTRDPFASREPMAMSQSPDRDGLDQRGQRLQVGGEIDVHVRHDVGGARRPRRLQRPAPPALFEAERAEPLRVAGRPLLGDLVGAVVRPVVGDDDAPPVGAQPLGAERRERIEGDGKLPLLVQAGNDDVERGHSRYSEAPAAAPSIPLLSPHGRD